MVSQFSLLLVLSSKLLHARDCGPVDTVSYRLATSAENGEWIQKWVISEYLSKVIFRSNVIWALVIFALFIQILNCGLVGACEHEMEPQKCGH